jgi:hypothetical protein
MKFEIELNAGDERFNSLVEFLNSNNIDYTHPHVLLQCSVSGWRAFEDELPKANELIMIMWPSDNYQPEFRILTEDDLKYDWSMMRWCPVPAYR